MRKIKRISALVMAIAIVASLLAAMPLNASASTDHYRVSTSGQLKEALKTLSATIYLRENFEYNAPIIIGRDEEYGYDPVQEDVTIYLEGRTLTIRLRSTSTNNGVEIYNNSSLTFRGPGTVNIDTNGYGIYAEGKNPGNNRGSRFLITGGTTVNVSVVGDERTALLACNNGDRIEVSSAAANGIKSRAIEARKGSDIIVSGNVAASGTGCYGVVASGKSNVDVSGTVTVSGTDSIGVYSANSGTVVDVNGHINASGNYCIAAYAEDNGYVYTSGDVKATSHNSIGALVTRGDIWVEGTISGEGNDIRLSDDGRNFSFGSPTRRNVGVGSGSKYYWHEFSRDSAKVYTRTDTGVGSGWRQSGRNWYYYKDNSMVKDEWLQDGATWYYLKGDGIMAANEQRNIKGVTYYFRENGAMATGWVRPKNTWYYYKSSGAQAKREWILDGGTWYYLKSDGEMAAGETIRIDGVSQTFLASGAWVNPSASSGGGSTSGTWSLQNGRWYWIKPGGTRATNEWVQDGGSWYWLKSDGRMAANETIRISGVSYTFLANGACVNPGSSGGGGSTSGAWSLQNGRWYWINPGGVRATSEWVLYNGAWYWIKSTGVMAANETVRITGKDYRFNASGVCTNP